MKRAKIILSAVAVFAVVGGALAFKANSVKNVTTFYHTTTRTGFCTVPIQLPYTTVAPTTLVSYSTAPTLTTLCSTSIRVIE